MEDEGGGGGRSVWREKEDKRKDKRVPFNGQEIIIVVHKGEEQQLNEPNCFCAQNKI
jgi:hypothetical protein